MEKFLELVKAWNVEEIRNGETFDEVFGTKHEAIEYACSLHVLDRQKISSIREVWAVSDGQDLAMCYGAEEAELEGFCDSCDYNGEELSELELEVIRRHGYAISPVLLGGLPCEVELEDKACFTLEERTLSVHFGRVILDEDCPESEGWEQEELANVGYFYENGKRFFGKCACDDLVEFFASRFGNDFVVCID